MAMAASPGMNGWAVNDMNGDGCITRDEWLGSDAVFDALDVDHDGRLTQEEVRRGFGSALSLTTA